MALLENVLAVLASIVVAGMPAMMALLKIRQLTLIINGRLSELLKVTAKIAHMEGQSAGRAEAGETKDILKELQERMDAVIAQRDAMAEERKKLVDALISSKSQPPACIDPETRLDDCQLGPNGP
jgi:hypothetical protein